jgi:hypothetical protein
MPDTTKSRVNKLKLRPGITYAKLRRLELCSTVHVSLRAGHPGRHGTYMEHKDCRFAIGTDADRPYGVVQSGDSRFDTLFSLEKISSIAFTHQQTYANLNIELR